MTNSLSIFLSAFRLPALLLVSAMLVLTACQEEEAKAPAEPENTAEAPRSSTSGQLTPTPQADQSKPVEVSNNTQSAPPASNARARHGAWSIICDVPAGASGEQCALMQNVIAEDRKEVGLSVVVLKTADKKARILRVLAPLGVILPNGLGLNVDGKDLGRAYFVRCLKDGCYAEVILNDDLISTLSASSLATFIIFETPEEGIGIPVDLTGFKPGFEALP